MLLDVEVIGSLAGACTTFSLVPQTLKIIRTKHTKDLSLATYVILTLGVFLWTIYGLAINDWPLIIANILCIFLAGTIVAMKLIYK